MLYICNDYCKILREDLHDQNRSLWRVPYRAHARSKIAAYPGACLADCYDMSTSEASEEKGKMALSQFDPVETALAAPDVDAALILAEADILSAAQGRTATIKEIG